MSNHDAACFVLAVPARVSGDDALRQQLQPKRGRRRKRKGRRRNKGRGYVTQFQLQAMVMSEVEKRERDQPSARRLRFERDVALVKLDKARRRIQQLEKSSVAGERGRELPSRKLVNAGTQVDLELPAPVSPLDMSANSELAHHLQGQQAARIVASALAPLFRGKSTLQIQPNSLLVRTDNFIDTLEAHRSAGARVERPEVVRQIATRLEVCYPFPESKGGETMNSYIAVVDLERWAHSYPSSASQLLAWCVERAASR